MAGAPVPTQVEAAVTKTTVQAAVYNLLIATPESHCAKTKKFVFRKLINTFWQIESLLVTGEDDQLIERLVGSSKWVVWQLIYITEPYSAQARL